jgi:CRP-like cAMP-binding protein
MTPIPPPEDQSLRHHSFDGIQEFDRRLPNWWMALLFGSIFFWVGYWAYFEWFRVGLSGPQQVAQSMAKIEAARLASAPTTDNTSLWAMSRNSVFVDAGRATYATTCASCHGAHDIRKSSDPASRTNHANVEATCAACHGNEAIIKQGNLPGGNVAGMFHDSVHGQAMANKTARIAYALLTKGEVFGERSSLLHNRISDSTVRATEDLRVLVIEAETLQQAVDRHPRLAHDLGQVMEIRRRALEGRRPHLAQPRGCAQRRDARGDGVRRRERRGRRANARRSA